MAPSQASEFYLPERGPRPRFLTNQVLTSNHGLDRDPIICGQ